MTVIKPTIIDKTPKLTKYNNGGKRSKTTKIAWHYTGIAGAKAINTINNWFNAITNGYKQNGKYLYASSHYLCDLDGTIYSYIPENYIAYTTNQANSYSIGIECATIGSDDHYPDVEYKSMIKLGAYLADKYNLDPRKDFIRHYDVTGKICPRYFVNNVKAWNQFKQDCYDELHKKEDTLEKKDKQLYLRVKANYLNVHNKPDFKSSSIISTVKKGTVLTVIDRVDIVGSSTDMYLTKAGVYITASEKYVEVFEK